MRTQQVVVDVFVENFLFSLMHFEVRIAFHEIAQHAYVRGVQATLTSLVVLSSESLCFIKEPVRFSLLLTKKPPSPHNDVKTLKFKLQIIRE